MPPADKCQACDGTTWVQATGGGVVRCSQCDSVRRGVIPTMGLADQKLRLQDYGAALQIKGNLAEVLKQVKYFVSGVHPDLYLHGGVGAGKTALACAALNELHHAQKMHCMFVRVPELLIQLQGEGDQERFDAVCNVAAIVLDDVGASQGTDFARRMLQAVYDARVAKGNKTIWTSNLDLDELTVFLEHDKRLPSRIAGQAKVLHLETMDFRLEKLKERQRRK